MCACDSPEHSFTRKTRMDVFVCACVCGGVGRECQVVRGEGDENAAARLINVTGRW